MFELIQPIVPVSCQAFEDYRLNAVMLTRLEVAAAPHDDGGRQPRSRQGL
jgi:hypothetical protein